MRTFSTTCHMIIFLPSSVLPSNISAQVRILLYNTLKLLQTDVLTELVRSKLNVDKLLLRQQQGFRCVNPSGYNAFGTQFE